MRCARYKASILVLISAVDCAAADSTPPSPTGHVRPREVETAPSPFTMALEATPRAAYSIADERHEYVTARTEQRSRQGVEVGAWTAAILERESWVVDKRVAVRAGVDWLMTSGTSSGAKVQSYYSEEQPNAIVPKATLQPAVDDNRLVLAPALTMDVPVTRPLMVGGRLHASRTYVDYKTTKVTQAAGTEAYAVVQDEVFRVRASYAYLNSPTVDLLSVTDAQTATGLGEATLGMVTLGVQGSYAWFVNADGVLRSGAQATAAGEAFVRAKTDIGLALTLRGAIAQHQDFLVTGVKTAADTVSRVAVPMTDTGFTIESEFLLAQILRAAVRYTLIARSFTVDGVPVDVGAHDALVAGLEDAVPATIGKFYLEAGVRKTF